MAGRGQLRAVGRRAVEPARHRARAPGPAAARSGTRRGPQLRRPKRRVQAACPRAELGANDLGREVVVRRRPRTHREQRALAPEVVGGYRAAEALVGWTGRPDLRAVARARARCSNVEQEMMTSKRSATLRQPVRVGHDVDVPGSMSRPGTRGGRTQSRCIVERPGRTERPARARSGRADGSGQERAPSPAARRPTGAGRAVIGPPSARHDAGARGGLGGHRRHARCPPGERRARRRDA